jgi:hypothetical protein
VPWRGFPAGGATLAGASTSGSFASLTFASVRHNVSTHHTTRDAQMWATERGRLRGWPNTVSTPSASNRRFHRLTVSSEQYKTALTVADGCPSARSSRMWARSRTSASADRW